MWQVRGGRPRDRARTPGTIRTENRQTSLRRSQVREDEHKRTSAADDHKAHRGASREECAPTDAVRWLDETGDPYARTGADLDGWVAIDWRVYGVPETFVIGRGGRIAYEHIGPSTPTIRKLPLLPLIPPLQARAA